jgi:hypothetical protein
MHLLNAHLAELSESSVILFFPELSAEFFLVHSLHLLNAHLAELLRILSDSGFLLNSQQSSSSMHHCAYAQCPLGRASQNSSELLSATVSLLHSLASKVFNNLEVFS